MIKDDILYTSGTHVDQAPSLRYICAKNNNKNIAHSQPIFAGGFGIDNLKTVNQYLFADIVYGDDIHRVCSLLPQQSRDSDTEGMDKIWISALPIGPHFVMNLVGQETYMKWVAENSHIGQRVNDGYPLATSETGNQIGMISTVATMLDAKQYYMVLEKLNHVYKDFSQDNSSDALFFAPSKEEIQKRAKLIAPKIQKDNTIIPAIRTKWINKSTYGEDYLWINSHINNIANSQYLNVDVETNLRKIADVALTIETNMGINREGILRNRHAYGNIGDGLLFNLEETIDAIYSSYSDQTNIWLSQIRDVIEQVDTKLEPYRKAYREAHKDETKKRDKLMKKHF